MPIWYGRPLHRWEGKSVKQECECVDCRVMCVHVCEGMPKLTFRNHWTTTVTTKVHFLVWLTSLVELWFWAVELGGQNVGLRGDTGRSRRRPNLKTWSLSQGDGRSVINSFSDSISWWETFCNFGTRRAENFSGENHFAIVVTEEQTISLVRNILQLCGNRTAELELLSGEKLSALVVAEQQNFSLVHKKKFWNCGRRTLTAELENCRFCTLIYSLIHACWSASDV